MKITFIQCDDYRHAIYIDGSRITDKSGNYLSELPEIIAKHLNAEYEEIFIGEYGSEELTNKYLPDLYGYPDRLPE